MTVFLLIILNFYCIYAFKNNSQNKNDSKIYYFQIIKNFQHNSVIPNFVNHQSILKFNEI